MSKAEQRALDRALSLSIWTAPQDARLLGGGITNFNVLVTDLGRPYVVRVGQDIPLHQIMRFNEQAVHGAAQSVGIAPRMVHAEPGILVTEFIDGTTLDEAGVRDPRNLERILPLIRRAHRDALRALRGPVLMFWVFHVLRDYADRLRRDGSRHVARLPGLLDVAERLEAAVGPVQIVLGHNDLLAANFIDDGERVWLLDWEYGGMNSPLFDLAGLASNNGLGAAQEAWMLEAYFGTPPGDALFRQYRAMKCASLLRETMWSMVSEIHSEIDFDYARYTETYLARFEAELADFQST